MTEKNKGGRPKSYTEAQVGYAIEQTEAQGLIPALETVKPILCGEFGVSATINSQSLERAIQEQVEIREGEKEKALIAKLPTSAREAASVFSDEMRISIVGLLARSFDGMRIDAEEIVTAKETDLRTSRARNRDLEILGAQKDDTIVSLEDEVGELRTRIASYEEEIADLRKQLASAALEDSLEARMLALLEEKVASKAQPMR